MRDKEEESERKWSSNLSLCLTSALQWASVIFNMPSTDGSDCKKSAGNVKDLDLIPGSGRSSAGGHGHPLQYSCLENSHGQRSLAGYSPWGSKESDTMEQLSTVLIFMSSDKTSLSLFIF